MNPCLRCGKRREHAFHDPRARVYAEDRHEYDDGYVDCMRCQRGVHRALVSLVGLLVVCPPCYDALKAVTV